jgi:DNA-directed RNA polymerase specialized sigma24 family protein
VLIGLLLETYWQPIYCYLRHKGYDRETAEDLTQDFLYDTVLVRNLIGRADIEKGHFRSFMLHTLRHYLIDKDRREKVQKCIPKAKLVSLETVDSSTLSQSLAQTTAKDAYRYAWIRTLLKEVASNVKTVCHRQGMEAHWDLFHEYVLQPTLDGSAPTLTHLCTKHGIEHTKKVSNMIVTVKRRFRSTLLQHVHSTVASEEQATEELDYFRCFLQQNETSSQNSTTPKDTISPSGHTSSEIQDETSL